jgi:hypothetical protein
MGTIGLRKSSDTSTESFKVAMMSSLDKESRLYVAIRLSNDLALQIRQGEYFGAAATLLTALATLREGVKIIQKSGHCSPSREEGTTTNTNEDSPLHFVASQREYDPPSTTDDTTNSNNNKSKVSDGWYLYEDPIRVCAEEALPASDCIEIISYAIIYNLGLCHHLEAQQFSSESTMHLRYLQRAVSFYSHAQNLMVSASLHDIGMMIHPLVLANNLGNVYHFLKNEPSSKVWLQRLLNAIFLITDSEQQGRQIVSNNERCFDGFLTNIMHLIGFYSAAAAA